MRSLLDIPTCLRATARAVATAALLCALPCRADNPPLPASLDFVPKVIEIYDEGYGYPGFTYKDWDEFKFRGDVGAKRGKYWKLQGWFKRSPDENVRWAAVKPAFLKAGWSLVSDLAGHVGLFHLTGKGSESWAQVSLQEDVAIMVIEAGDSTAQLELAAPGPTPEKMDGDKGDFPYLKPLAGWTFHGGGQDTRPFWVTPPGAQQEEMVAPASVMRTYDQPPALSNLQFVTLYRQAFVKAGWDVVSEFNSADAQLVAHYAKKGRDIWAKVHLGGASISINVADVGNDLKASLAKDCHIALYGVLFDFNKSTLQAASDGVLQRVEALMTKSPQLKIEVQGHTDNVGDDAYNQKLSEARAASVMKWLEGHGIAASRLSSRGYGKTQPVADNKTDEGRAKNRRVEISDPSCKPKTK